MGSYFSYKEYMKQEYGYELYSVPVDISFGCPNKDSSGLGGCSFCPEDGARAMQTREATSVKEQIQKAIAFAKKRYNAQHFILYIQAYTGTFSSLREQKQTYESLLSLYEFKALSIGTRPDCLSKSTIEYLADLNTKIDVSVDLGIQTLNDATLKKVNRGHDAKTSLDAVKRLKSHGIKVYGHVIIGFEGECRADWQNCVKSIIQAGVDGIKFHNLHIIKNTLLAQEYEEKPFKTLDPYEYAEELLALLPLIPSYIPVLRFTTDTQEDELIAPKWHMSKGEFLRLLTEQMRYRGIRQGSLVGARQEQEKKLQSVTCKDGSISFWDEKYKNHYHPKAGATKQARELFCVSSSLKERLSKTSIKLLDIGFGMGYNTLEALKVPRKFSLHVKALDQNLEIIKQSAQTLEKQELYTLYKKRYFEQRDATVELLIGDIRHTLKDLAQEEFDVIFLDPFLHTQNTTMITQDVLQLITRTLKKNGVLVASTNSQAVRVALGALGYKSKILQIAKSDIRGIVATVGQETIEGVAYRDPHLVLRDKQIIHQRDREICYNTKKI